MRKLSHAIMVTLCLQVLFGCAHQKESREHEKFQATERTWDTYIQLEFRGEVKDAADDVPLPYTELNFLDTGLAPHAAEGKWTTRVGTADSSGRVDQRFMYGWYFESTPDALGVEWPEDLFGTEEGAQFFELLDTALDKVRAKGTFTVELRRAGYNTVTLDVSVGTCARDGDAYIVDLGTVLMNRQGTASPRDVDSARNDG